MDKNVRQINFNSGNNETGKYKVEAALNSKVYTRELESSHYLSGRYCLVL